jgi:hypothetical protein
MDIFYRKFYADSTPFWLHGLVITGINLPWRFTQLKYNLLKILKRGFSSQHAQSAEVSQ